MLPRGFVSSIAAESLCRWASNGLLPLRFAIQGYCWWNSRFRYGSIAIRNNYLRDFTSHYLAKVHCRDAWSRRGCRYTSILNGQVPLVMPSGAIPNQLHLAKGGWWNGGKRRRHGHQNGRKSTSTGKAQHAILDPHPGVFPGGGAIAFALVRIMHVQPRRAGRFGRFAGF